VQKGTERLGFMDSNGSRNRCFLCTAVLTRTNETKEHIIAQAIGGRKKVMGFICLKCNTKTGRVWDNELADQFHDLGLFLRINRQRGTLSPRTIETDKGKELLLHHDGNMSLPRSVVTETRVGDQMSVRIQASTMRELKKHLNGLSRKYPGKFDVEKLLEENEIQASYLTDPIKLSQSMDLDLAGKSIVKSVAALVSDAQVNMDACNLAMAYLVHGKGFPLVFYTGRELVKNRSEGIPMHCVSVSGDPGAKRIIGYFEIYGIYRVLIHLSDSFDGIAFQHSYAINPMSGAEVDVEVDLDFAKNEFMDLVKPPPFNQQDIIDRLSAVLGYAQQQNRLKDRDSTIEQAILRAIKKLGLQSGDTIPPGFGGAIFDELLPWLEHQIGMGRQSPGQSINENLN